MEEINQLLAEIKDLENQLEGKRKVLQAKSGELKKLVALVATGGKSSNVTGAGRPKGSTNGEVSVSKQVLTAITETADVGTTRAELLKKFPDRESAVQAALRVHQVAGKIFNSEHRWYYNANYVEPVESPVQAPVVASPANAA